MNQNTISDLPSLDSTRYENIFNVYNDSDGYYYYNLLQTIVFPQNLPDSFFNAYAVTPGDTWPMISYRNYNTINLWWLIMLANGLDNPISTIESGTVLKIPKNNVVREILTQII